MGVPFKAVGGRGTSAGGLGSIEAPGASPGTAGCHAVPLAMPPGVRAAQSAGPDVHGSARLHTTSQSPGSRRGLLCPGNSVPDIIANWLASAYSGSPQPIIRAMNIAHGPIGQHAGIV